MITVKIDIPRSMYDAALSEEVQNAPNYLCLYCPFMGQTCSGIDPWDFEGPELARLATKLMKDGKLTRQDVADASNVPIGTIHNFLSGKTSDIRISTLRGIFSVILKNCKGKAPCHFASMLIKGELVEIEGEDELQKVHAELQDSREELQRMQARVRHLENTLEGIHKAYSEELTLVRNEEKAKVVFLKNQVEIKDKQNNALSERIRRQDAVIDKLTGG